MNGKSDRPISFSVSFCICGRSFKLISFTFVCERETLGAVHSTQLWVLVKYIYIYRRFLQSIVAYIQVSVDLQALKIQPFWTQGLEDNRLIFSSHYIKKWFNVIITTWWRHQVNSFKNFIFDKVTTFQIDFTTSRSYFIQNLRTYWS